MSDEEKEGKARTAKVEEAKRFRDLCEESEARITVADMAHLLPSGIGLPTKRLNDELTSLLERECATDFDKHDLRRIETTFRLDHAIGKPGGEWAVVVRAIASCLPAGKRLPDLDNPVWSKIIDLGRGLVEAKLFDSPDQRTTAVAAAGARLTKCGFRLATQGSSYEFVGDSGIRATREIQTALDRLGQVNVLRAIFERLRMTGRTPYGLYMPVRSYAYDRCEPSYPYGFLVHLAVRSPVFGQGNGSSRRKRGRAFELARDLVATLNVEPYNKFSLIGAAPGRIDGLLRELPLFDHLFALPQQWPPGLARMALREFFRCDDADALWARLGWTISDVVALYDAVVGNRGQDPILIARPTLAWPGLPRARVERMLPHFVHARGTVNAGYDSPLAAGKANLMFKPLIQVKPEQFMLPAASFAGPAFYEAVMAAIRNENPRGLDDLQGRGTERVVAALLEGSALRVTAKGAKYKVEGGGECDLVVESERHVLFVECKAKALTRDAMAGVEGGALLDFGGGMFAAQAQAMRHERILRKLKRIDFVDGHEPLLFDDREIFRLSVTLLDHGSLQDRMVLWSLYDALLDSEVTVSGDHGKQGQVHKLNRTLNRMRAEARALRALGVEQKVHMRNCASLSVASLAVLLHEVVSLEDFLALVASPVTYATYNPLFESYHLRKSGLVSG